MHLYLINVHGPIFNVDISSMMNTLIYFISIIILLILFKKKQYIWNNLVNFMLIETKLLVSTFRQYYCYLDLKKLLCIRVLSGIFNDSLYVLFCYNVIFIFTCLFNGVYIYLFLTLLHTIHY